MWWRTKQWIILEKIDDSMQLEVRSKKVYVLSPLIYPHSLLAYTHRKGKKCLYCLCIYCVLRYSWIWIWLKIQKNIHHAMFYLCNISLSKTVIMVFSTLKVQSPINYSVTNQCNDTFCHEKYVMGECLLNIFIAIRVFHIKWSALYWR